jgi:hypothetical protein
MSDAQRVRDEPTAAERLAMEICELREDIDELRNRLDGRRPQDMDMEQVRKERARRWERTLATWRLRSAPARSRS